MGLPSEASPAAVLEISDDESGSETSLTSLTQLLEEWMDEEMASMEKEQTEQKEQVGGGPAGDLRSEEISAQGPAEVSTQAAASVEAPQQSHGEDLASLPWELLWRKLEAQGWQIEHGPRGKGRQAYYLPPGVKRGPGKKNRVDYFDSRKLVLQLLSCKDGRGTEVSEAAEVPEQ
ncbi:unnamed protein product [Symbiodinium necroappetens]|uniref:Uncharacterized protein n=1 Tax=Symbiodinium necroappetens TaxID=1628268 RepID=A0A812XZQ0_9DINO|nr:unnamed protein product [Symbiodinium necroappetens]